MTLKVTYLDQGSEWKAAYNSKDRFLETEPVKGSGDGKEKTATFLLKDFRPAQTVEAGFSLALETIQGDLTVSFVRLIR